MIRPDEEEENTPGHMRYGMLGDDISTDLEKLAKYTGDVPWTYIKPHYNNGALLYVDPALDITAVGKALAEDDKAQRGRMHEDLSSGESRLTRSSCRRWSPTCRWRGCC